MSFLEMEGVRQGASPRGSVIKNLPAMHETRVPCLGEKAPGGGHDNPLQYSCLENSKDRGAWRLQFVGSQRVRHDGSDWACAQGRGANAMNSNSILLVLYYNPKFAIKNETTHCCELTITWTWKLSTIKKCYLLEWKPFIIKMTKTFFPGLNNIYKWS